MSIISDYYKFYRGGEPSIDFENTIRAAISLLITKIQERDAKDDVAVTKHGLLPPRTLPFPARILGLRSCRRYIERRENPKVSGTKKSMTCTPQNP